MAWADLISGIFKPVSDVIDHVLPSGEAKIQLQQKLMEAQVAAAQQTMEYEKQLLDGQIQIIKAEATGQSWLQRNWRPLTMVTFLVLVVCDSFGVLPFRLAGEARLRTVARRLRFGGMRRNGIRHAGRDPYDKTNHTINTTASYSHDFPFVLRNLAKKNKRLTCGAPVRYKAMMTFMMATPDGRHLIRINATGGSCSCCQARYWCMPFQNFSMRLYDTGYGVLSSCAYSETRSSSSCQRNSRSRSSTTPALVCLSSAS